MTENIIEKYCEENGLRIAKVIDKNMAFVINPKPKYCPYWLYKKIIKDSVGLIEIKS